MYKSKINSSIGSNAKLGNELTCGLCASACVKFCGSSCVEECNWGCEYSCQGGCVVTCIGTCTVRCASNSTQGLGPVAFPKKYI